MAMRMGFGFGIMGGMPGGRLAAAGGEAAGAGPLGAALGAAPVSSTSTQSTFAY